MYIVQMLKFHIPFFDILNVFVYVFIELEIFRR